jgi:transcriptional regulator with XRE-family HTH domain
VWYAVAGAVPTVPRLFLGEALKRLRADSGKTLDEIGVAIGKDRGRLIRLLDGKGTLTTEELTDLLDVLGATPKQKQELLALGAETRKRPTRRPYTDLLSDPAKTMHFVITDDALHTQVGGSEIMARQLAYLLHIIDERPNFPSRCFSRRHPTTRLKAAG